MQRSPRVSIVIPTYRRPQLMGRALQSVLDQSYDDFEVIVVDDNTKGWPAQKETARLIEARFNDPRVRYIANEVSQGAGRARNVGIEQAKGEYVAFLDDDEDWEAEKLSKQVTALDAADPEVGVIDTGFYDWKQNGKVKPVMPKMQGWILHRLLQKTGGRAPKLSTMLCRRSALFDVGLFDTALSAREDYDLYIRLARHYRFESVKEPLSNKRANVGTRKSGNFNNRAKGFEQVYRKIEPDLKPNPRSNAIYLLKFAAALSMANRHAEARGKYFQAFRLWHWNPRLLTYGFKLLHGRFIAR